jgi:hypothetical protein
LPKDKGAKPEKKKKEGESNDDNQEEFKAQNPDFYEIATNVEAYLNDKYDNINIDDVDEAKAYIRAMKDFYANRMKEYCDELNIISGKLRKYEDILARR